MKKDKTKPLFKEIDRLQEELNEVYGQRNEMERVARKLVRLSIDSGVDQNEIFAIVQNHHFIRKEF